MRIKRVYVPDVLQGNTIVLRDGSYTLSIICSELKEGSLYVDKCIFYATGLPLFTTVNWKLQDDYLDFYLSDNLRNPKNPMNPRNPRNPRNPS